jgi:CheY-like chemotaxis protein
MSEESLRRHFAVLNKAVRAGRAGARECAAIESKLLQTGAGWRVSTPGSLQLPIPASRIPSSAAVKSALLVDDQTGIRAIVRRILECRGFVVTDAGSGEEALSLLDRRKEPFALLVAHTRTPGATGRELADRVRLRHPSTRILFIGGRTDDPGIPSGMQVRFLSEPFHPGQMAEAVTKLME